MSERGEQLLNTAERQISQVRALIAEGGEAFLRRPCPGREKLGDGSVAALASHTADTYHRIATFIARGESGHDRVAGDHLHSAQRLDPDRLLGRLAAAQLVLAPLAELTDTRLDAVPAAGTARFCDGQRTVEQVVTSMLRHQSHQIEALTAAA
jgi:hypothetical protein